MLHSNEQEVSEIDREISVLQEIAGDEATHSPPPTEGAHVLSGRDIREVAVRLLVLTSKVRRPVHYRAWLEHLRDAGYEVAGKRPDAVFLAQVTRSPVVKANGKAGFYEVDPTASDRLRQQIIELRERLVGVATEDHVTPGELSDQADRTQALSLEIRRAERALDEAVRTAQLQSVVDLEERKGAKNGASSQQHLHA